MTFDKDDPWARPNKNFHDIWMPTETPDTAPSEMEPHAEEDKPQADIDWLRINRDSSTT